MSDFDFSKKSDAGGTGPSQAQLPSGWSTAVDPSSGKTYYFNSTTNETSWDPPVDDGTKKDKAPEYYWDGLRWVEAQQSGSAGWHYDAATGSYTPVAVNYGSYSQTPTAFHSTLVGATTESAVSSEAADAQKRLLQCLATAGAKTGADNPFLSATVDTHGEGDAASKEEENPFLTEKVNTHGEGEASSSMVDLYKAWQAVDQHAAEEAMNPQPPPGTEQDDRSYTDPGGFVVINRRTGALRDVGAAYDTEFSYMTGPPEGAYGDKFFDYNAWSEKKNQESKLKAEKEPAKKGPAKRKGPYGGPRMFAGRPPGC